MVDDGPEGSERQEFDPRPEFQHGKLEANPILVDVRDDLSYTHSVESRIYTVSQVLESWGGYIQWAQGEVTTSEQRTHAHRVLTLWLAVFA